MKINKQLFEDVLSSKLKGTFVLRNSEKIPSDALNRQRHFYGLYIDGYPYLYYDNGRYSLVSETRADIIDFIPNTNMKENELAIEIPNGKIVDWDESKKQNKIVLKDKQLTYGDICEKLFKDWVYFIDQRGDVCSGHTYCITDSNNAPTKHQLECILAKNKLANVAKYLNNGCNLNDDKYYVIVYCKDVNKPYIEAIFRCSVTYGLTVFKTKELAQQAIEILGEETVKLALEPLGI